MYGAMSSSWYLFTATYAVPRMKWLGSMLETRV